MSDADDQVLEGQLVLLTEGAYSDFRVVGLYRAEHAFDMAELMRSWREKVNPDCNQFRDNLTGFAEQLVIDGHLRMIDYNEQDLGAYDTFDRAGLNIAKLKMEQV